LAGAEIEQLEASRPVVRRWCSSATATASTTRGATTTAAPGRGCDEVAHVSRVIREHRRGADRNRERLVAVELLDEERAVALVGRLHPGHPLAVCRESSVGDSVPAADVRKAEDFLGTRISGFGRALRDRGRGILCVKREGGDEQRTRE